MNVSRRGQRRLVHAGAVAMVLLMLATGSACSDPEASNYVRVETGKIVVDRPIGWAVEMPVEAPWTQGFRLAPESVEQLQISGDFGEFVTASQAMGTLIGQAQVTLAGFTVVQTRDIEVKGATTAQLVQYTITDNSGSQVSGEWIVAAHWPYPQSVAVSILRPQPDPDLERRVLESLELKPVLK